ncbi:MAG: endonuclease III domain-containing protein, partial [Planctomycetota bacterium]
MSATLEEVYDRLLAAYGSQHWWPGDSPFEVLVGAVLVQNTAWKNVAKAIDRLKQEGLLEPRVLYDLPTNELEELIRPAGYFRLKARRLRNLLELLVDRYGGSLEAMFATELSTLREELLGVNGVGPETADSILLYAGGRPTFVVDTYTLRVLARHGWIHFDADYHQI